MKIERLLAEYLYKQGRLTLPGIGVIHCDGEGEVEIDEQSGLHRFQPGSLRFEFDQKSEMDEALVMHLSRETGKMRSLAASDLQSFIQFGQELINISKPFHIKGLGILQKTPAQEIEFIQEDIPNTKLERVRRYGAETRKQDSFNPTSDASETRGFPFSVNLVWGLGLLLLMSGGYALFRYLGNPGEIVAVGKPAPSKTDTTAKVAFSSDVSKSRGVFRVILENSSRERAFNRYADLKEWGHDIRMSTKDSVRYKLYIPIDAPLSDTARHRDSLRIFFGRPVRVETGKDE